MNKRKFFSKKDMIPLLILIVISIVLFLIFYINRGEGKKLRILYNSETLAVLPLDKDCTYTPKTDANIIIEINNRRARFVTSDCPDKVCVNTGWLTSPGQSAVCLPNRLSITIEGESNTDTTL